MNPTPTPLPPECEQAPVNEAGERESSGKQPVWVKLQLEMREQGIEIEPVPVVDDDGGVLPVVRDVLAMIARNGMVLATGHLARDEIFAIVDAAVQEGVRDIVITHPEFPSQNLGVDDQRTLAERGALLERCFTTPHTGKVTWERWLENIRLGVPDWKPGDRIHRGPGDTLEVVEVRASDDLPVLVVRSGHGPKKD